MSKQCLAARFIVLGDGPMVENGRVVIDDGLIAAVGPAGEIDEPVTTDFGQAVLMPGLVNAHTHLELTHLAGKVPPEPAFTSWLAGLMRELTRTPIAPKDVQAATRDGLDQSLAGGVTTIGDIARNHAWVRPVLSAGQATCVSYGEVVAIGTSRDALQERLQAAMTTTVPQQRVIVGLSPHAPYTVEPQGLRQCAHRADTGQTRLCIHAAETPDEDAFTTTGTGPLADHLRAVGVWDEHIPTAGLRPIPLLMDTGLLTPRTIVAHANYVDPDDIALLARSGASVAYCPRTHAAFGHKPHEFREMLRAGVNVCVGTDSLASNPDLSVLKELRFLRRRHPDLSPEVLVSMGTIRGAIALGLVDRLGTLRPGKRADIVVLPATAGQSGWSAILDADTPPQTVFLSSGCPFP